MVSILEMSFNKLQINQTLQQLWHGKNIDVLHWENISVYNIMSSQIYVSLLRMWSYLKWPPHTNTAEFWTTLRIYWHVPREPLSFSRLQYALSVSLSLSLLATSRHGRRRPSFGRFCASNVTCLHEPFSFNRLQLALSLCLCTPHAFVSAGQYRKVFSNTSKAIS
jgi:hypothetical protein